MAAATVVAALAKVPDESYIYGIFICSVVVIENITKRIKKKRQKKRTQQHGTEAIARRKKWKIIIMIIV